MDSTLLLSHYTLRDGVFPKNYNLLIFQQNIEFQRRVYNCTIELPLALSPYSVSLDRLATTQEIVDLIQFNYFHHFERMQEYQLCISRDGTVLREYESLWSIDEPKLTLKRKPLPITVMMENSRQMRVLVDFSVSVGGIMGGIWEAFHMESRSEFVVKRISPGMGNFWESSYWKM
jgi:hypothetical protein